MLSLIASGEPCATTSGINDPTEFSLADLLSSLPGEQQIKKRGRPRKLGRSQRYSCFLFRRALMISLILFEMRLMKYCIFLLAARMSFLACRPRNSYPDTARDSAASRWLNKKVIASRVLDDMESPAHWTAFSTGAPEVVDARAVQK